MSSARSVSNSKALRRISPRARGSVAAHSSAAATAASSASMPCAGEASATEAIVLPVEGSSTSTLPSVVIHFPPINRPFGTAFNTREICSSVTPMVLSFPSKDEIRQSQFTAQESGRQGVDRVLQDVESLGQQGLRDHQRRQEPQYVAVGTRRQHDDTFSMAGLGDCAG